MKKRNIMVILAVILSIVLVTALFIVFSNKNEDKNNEDKIPNTKFVETYLMEFEDYKNVNLDDIESIEIIRYTVAGDNRQPTITDSDEIKNIYNSLSKIKLVEETKMRCEDNTTVYVFHLKDNSKVSIEFECNWLVTRNKRYLIKREG